MPRVRIALLILSLACSSQCGADEQATSLPTPSGAVEIQHYTFNDGHASQTNFKLIAKFPGNPALEHYAASLDGSWTSCAWMDSWNHFLDRAKRPAVTVHQTGHVWLRPQSRRMIMLSVRNTSSDKCAADRPETDEQQVVLVEYSDADANEVANQLGLTCLKK